MAMKAYKSYKNTDQFWLKQIPSHWDIHKIKYVFNERSEKGHPEEPLLVSSQNMGVVPKSVYGNRTVEAMKGLDTLKLVKVGDFVISLRSFQGGIEYAYYQGIISPAYTIMILKGHVTPEYFRHLAKSDAFIKLLKLCVTGIREGQNINYTLLRNYRIPMPPKEEQDQIVRYLDWQNSRLNKLINAKKKEIALLEEQKQALISQAVTKGLDPHSPLKDSGIDWIGQIPEHWEIRRLKSMLKSPLEYGANMSGIPYDSSLPRYIRITDIETSTTLKSDNKLSLPISDLTSRYLLKTGDVLFARSGATVAKTYIVSENDLPAAYAGYLIKCCANEKYLLPLFLLFYSQSHPYTLWKDAIFIQATIQNISAEKYNNLQLPVPSVTEQTEICEYLARKSSYFDNIIKIKAKTISLLQEYRTRLVADVVTGQIDVRHITIPNYETVPETIDQPETAEESAISAEDQ